MFVNTKQAVLNVELHPLTYSFHNIQPMKRTLLILLSFLFIGALQAQDCERDSNLYVTMELLSPAPYTPDSPSYNLQYAIIDEPYEQSITVLVPAEFSGFMIDSVGIPIMDGVEDLPDGITYECDPPNCIFLPLTLGCIRLYGTPSNMNMIPDTADLAITATVYTALIDLPVDFPGQIAPGSHYYIPISDVVSVGEQGHPDLSKLKVYPNPFQSETTIEVNAAETAGYLLEVRNAIGQTVRTEKHWLQQGQNRINFQAGDLQPGYYFYTLGNSKGSLTGSLQIH